MPPWTRRRATLSAPCLVRVKTSARSTSGAESSSASSVGLLDEDLDRVVEHAVGQLLDRRRHGGREEQRLALPGQRREDPLDVRDEAQVEHVVGFVEDQDLDRAEARVALAHQVHEPPGCGDQHVEAAVQRGDLLLLAHAPEDHGHAELQPATVGLEALGDLRGELARRREDQRAHAVGCGAASAGREQLQHGQREGSGLAGAGLGATEQVAPFEQMRDGLRLDRCRSGVARIAHGSLERLDELETGESVRQRISSESEAPRGESPGRRNNCPGTYHECAVRANRPRAR